MLHTSQYLSYWIVVSNEVSPSFFMFLDGKPNHIPAISLCSLSRLSQQVRGHTLVSFLMQIEIQFKKNLELQFKSYCAVTSCSFERSEMCLLTTALHHT